MGAGGMESEIENRFLLNYTIKTSPGDHPNPDQQWNYMISLLGLETGMIFA